MRFHLRVCALLVVGLSISPVTRAQGPVVDIESRQDGNLAAAQRLLVQAYALIGSAEHVNDGQLDGHGQKARAFINQANAELKAAAISAAEYRARLQGAN